MARPTTSRPVPRLRLPWRRWARRARRSPVLWWLVAGGVALQAALRVGAIDDEAVAARAAWGEPVPVVVAVRDLAPGDVVGAVDVTVEHWPPAVVPAAALDEPPVGRTVSAAIVAGEVVVAARVAPDGLSGVAALLPSGWRAVAVPAGGGGFGSDLPPLAVGDRVDVLAGTATFDDVALDLEVVAGAALVVDVTDTTVTVGVPAASAPAVAAATTRGTVTLALVGAG